MRAQKFPEKKKQGVVLVYRGLTRDISLFTTLNESLNHGIPGREPNAPWGWGGGQATEVTGVAGLDVLIIRSKLLGPIDSDVVGPLPRLWVQRHPGRWNPKNIRANYERVKLRDLRNLWSLGGGKVQ